MLALDVDTALDFQVLEDLDFPVPCGHPHHDLYKEWHDEGAAHWLYTYTGPCGFSVTRPVCDRFAASVFEAPFWNCSGCGSWHLAREVQITIEPLTPAS